MGTVIRVIQLWKLRCVAMSSNICWSSSSGKRPSKLGINAKKIRYAMITFEEDTFCFVSGFWAKIGERSDFETMKPLCCQHSSDVDNDVLILELGESLQSNVRIDNSSVQYLAVVKCLLEYFRKFDIISSSFVVFHSVLEENFDFGIHERCGFCKLLYNLLN